MATRQIRSIALPFDRLVGIFDPSDKSAKRVYARWAPHYSGPATIEVDYGQPGPVEIVHLNTDTWVAVGDGLEAKLGVPGELQVRATAGKA